MVTYAEALDWETSKPLAYANFTHFKWFFGWVPDSSVWYADLPEVVALNMFEKSVGGSLTEMTKTASLSALQAQSTVSVGAWWWDFDNERMYVKPKDTETVYDGNRYLGVIRIDVSDSSNVLDGERYDASITRLPTQVQRGNEILDGSVSQIGGGAVSIQNVDKLIIRLGLEPDGVASLVEQIGVLQ